MAEIELLQAHHDTTAFRCGMAALDSHLREALRYGMRTWVIVPEPGSSTVVTYCQLEPDPVECVSEGGLYLGCIDVIWARYLATDFRYQRQGYAAMMLGFIIEQTVIAGEVHPIDALMMDAIDWEVRGYYLRLPYGFRALSPNSLRLALPMRAMRELVGIR